MSMLPENKASHVALSTPERQPLPLPEGQFKLRVNEGITTPEAIRTYKIGLLGLELLQRQSQGKKPKNPQEYVTFFQEFTRIDNNIKAAVSLKPATEDDTQEELMRLKGENQIISEFGTPSKKTNFRDITITTPEEWQEFTELFDEVRHDFMQPTTAGLSMSQMALRTKGKLTVTNAAAINQHVKRLRDDELTQAWRVWEAALQNPADRALFRRELTSPAKKAQRIALLEQVIELDIPHLDKMEQQLERVQTSMQKIADYGKALPEALGVTDFQGTTISRQ